MATELVIVHHCDACLADDGTKHPAVFAVTMGALEEGPARLDVEVCEQHAPVLRDAWALVSRYGTEGGASVTSAPPATGNGPDLDCPRCGNPYRNRSSLRSHLRNVHRVTAAELAATMPGRNTGGSALTPTPCEIPGCNYVAASKVGLIAHVRHTHPADYAAFRNTDAGRNLNSSAPTAQTDAPSLM